MGAGGQGPVKEAGGLRRHNYAHRDRRAIVRNAGRHRSQHSPADPGARLLDEAYLIIGPFVWSSVLVQVDLWVKESRVLGLGGV